MAAAAVAVQDGLYLRTGELINLQGVDIVVPQRAANHRDFTVAVQICPRDRLVVTKAGLSNNTVIEVVPSPVLKFSGCGRSPSSRRPSSLPPTGWVSTALVCPHDVRHSSASNDFYHSGRFPAT